MRKHGLQWPLDMHQVGSWIVFTFLVSGVYIFYIPFVDSLPARIALTGLYSVLVLSVLALGYATSSSDPSDPALSDGSCDGEFYCTICQASVGGSSKHCRSCDRCVEGFDHHCKWLNNCIGSSNYRPFFSLLVTTISMLLVQLGCGLWLLARSIYSVDTMTDLVASKYGSLQYRGWQAVLVLYLLLIAVSLLTLGELLVFHVVLISKNMTTYDYIMAQRQLREGEPMSPRASAAASDSRVGARAALCRSNRVLDTSLTVVLPKRKSLKVGLNPCAACKTQKLPGSVRQWEKGGKAGAAAMQMPADPEKPSGLPDTLATSFSAACTSDSGASYPEDKPMAAACGADTSDRLDQSVALGQGGRDTTLLACDSGVNIARREKKRAAAAGGPQSPKGNLAGEQHPQQSQLGGEPAPLKDVVTAGQQVDRAQLQPPAEPQLAPSTPPPPGTQDPMPLAQRRLLAPLSPLPGSLRAAAAIPPSPTVAGAPAADQPAAPAPAPEAS